MSRTNCHACTRPLSQCVCSAIQPVHNRTPVWILQHPAERKHAFNTARLARLALEKVELQVAWAIEHPCPPLLEGAVLLFPSEDAIQLDALEKAPSQIVVLDGTWPHARSLYRCNPWVQNLPHVLLTPTEPSRYTIRREPDASCLSTIEAITAALQVCEPDNPSIPDLLLGFEAMVRAQVQHVGKGARPRRSKREGVSRIARLRQDWNKVVVLYAETSPLRAAAGAHGTEVLQLTALRPSTGEVFDHVASVRALPDPCVLRHMGLAEATNNAPPFSELAAAWSLYQTPEDVYVAWSWGAAKSALACLGDHREALPLKSIYCNLRRRAAGRPDQLLVRESIAPMVVDARGRAAARLGNAAALARWLGEQAAM